MRVAWTLPPFGRLGRSDPGESGVNGQNSYRVVRGASPSVGHAGDRQYRRFVTESGLEPPPGSTLEDQLCFALYAASHAMTGRYRPDLDSLGLTYPQYLVMLVLWEHRCISVGEISQRLRLATGTLSPLLKRLENAGLLARRRRSDDERVVQLTVTAAGAELMGRALPVVADLRNVLKVTADDVGELIDQLTALTARTSIEESRRRLLDTAARGGALPTGRNI